METGNFSRLRHVNRKISGFNLYRNSGLHNKFPDHSISKMEIFFPKNGNPSSITLGIFICMKMLINLNA